MGKAKPIKVRIPLTSLTLQAFSENFTGLELEDGGGRGTSG